MAAGGWTPLHNILLRTWTSELRWQTYGHENITADIEASWQSSVVARPIQYDLIKIE